LIWTECLLYDRHLVGVFCFDRPGAEPEPCVRTVLYYLGIPFLITLLVSHIALRMDALPALVAGTGVSVLLPIVYMIVSAAILSLTFFGMKRIFRLLLIVGRFKYMGVVRHGVLKGHSLKRSRLSLDLKDRHSESGDEEAEHSAETRRRHLYKFSFWFTLSVFLSQISMLLLYRLSGTLSWGSFLFLTVICTSGVFISNIVVAIRYRHYLRQAVAASLVTAMLLLFVADGFSSLSEGILDFYGFGANHKANLLVTDEGLAIIDKLGLPDEYRTPNREGLRNVEVL